MLPPPPPQPTYTVRRATLADLPTLSTIVPRSFHPTNAYIRTLFPDTPLLQKWWTEIFTSKILQPEPKISHLLTITQSNTPTTIKSNYETEPEPKNQTSNETSTPPTLGILSLQFFPPSTPGAGLYTTFPPTCDHDSASYDAVATSLASAREELMSDRAHFCVELFGVDHALQGRGLGKLLLRRACEIADEVGVEVFVMANESASGVYVGVGFEERRRVVLEGGYGEVMLVRPVGVGG